MPPWQGGAGAARGEVTVLLAQLQAGGRDAFGRLIDRIYPVLRRMANRHVRRERRHHVLQPTALVSEAYLRLVKQSDHRWNNRAHFYGAASHAMRRVLVDYARAAKAQKRIDTAVIVPLDDARHAAEEPRVDLLALDEALRDLEKLSPRQATIVQLRFFGGLSASEIADALAITTRTVDRDWATARAWLRLRLQEFPRSRQF
jgi:RNA polymerase sigma factor (TIGR02999 family)